MILVMISSPAYMMLLFTDMRGQAMLLGAGLWMGCGNGLPRTALQLLAALAHRLHALVETRPPREGAQQRQNAGEDGDAHADAQQVLRVGDKSQKAVHGVLPLTFYFFRFATPFIFMVLTGLYLFVVNDFGMTLTLKLCVLVFAAAAGFYAPNIYVQNRIASRRQSIVAAFPHSLDLLLPAPWPLAPASA